MATTKTTKNPAVQETDSTTKAVEEASVVTEKPQPKTYKPDDLIPCRSITAGTLLYNGPKSQIPYSWSNEGDISYVEYQDLLAAMVSRSDYIYDPLFLIEDEELLEGSKWKAVRELYEGLYDHEDVQAILDLPVRQFTQVFSTLPLGIKNTIKSKVASQLQEGTFDSLSKVKIIDEVCGTALHCMM